MSETEKAYRIVVYEDGDSFTYYADGYNEAFETAQRKAGEEGSYEIYERNVKYNLVAAVRPPAFQEQQRKSK